MIRRDLHQQNRLAWDAATPAHSSHKRDEAGFLRDGGTTLFDDEVHLLLGTGPEGHVLEDILKSGARPLSGLRLLHAPCNAGQDTLSLAQLGADVTGVDISPTAIAAAQTLAEETGIPARFVVGDLYDWLPACEVQFDVVFMTYGALIWMSDIDALFAAIARVLRPGGRLVGLEFHPLAMMFDEHGKLFYPYSGGAHVVGETGVGDYVAASGTALAPSGFVEGQVGFKNPHATHEFSWGVADILGAQLRAGLVLEVVREYPYANGCKIWPDLVEQPGRRYAPAGGAVPPLMLGWSSRRPE
ncbi:class I SAM-dependent methyltransferase [Nannocystis sp. ILAH1]|uniref:class I SAM-dependent methyltransferase n=1 Tax=unclassified Nannocystis TaxID=2627009 RepID=UPI00226FD5AE|nr:class I SAM-dependent methyltransferase [Nannocystis sp. ILAH1]MCY1064128.1 class I SAM-dependent methyltransferase [Nannocystis sp. RBIL2]